MHPDELLKFLNHIIVWTPHGSYVRGKIQEVINQLKAQKQ